MVLLAAARDLHQDAIPATKSRSGRRPKTSKYTDDLLIRELRKNYLLRTSELKEMHPDHLGNVSVRCIQHSLQKNLNTPSPRAAYKPLLISHMGKKCFQFALKYLHRRADDWKRSCCLMNLPFSASPITNKGHLGAIIDP